MAPWSSITVSIYSSTSFSSCPSALSCVGIRRRILIQLCFKETECREYCRPLVSVACVGVVDGISSLCGFAVMNRVVVHRCWQREIAVRLSFEVGGAWSQQWYSSIYIWNSHILWDNRAGLQPRAKPARCNPALGRTPFGGREDSDSGANSWQLLHISL